MNFLIVEDDYTWFDFIRDEFEDEFAGLEITRFGSESEFLKYFHDDDSFKKPDLYLIDLIVRFATPTTDEQPQLPPNYEKDGGRFEAGLRCAQAIRNTDDATPIILYSVSEAPKKLRDLGLANISFESKKESIGPWIESIKDKLKNKQ